MTNVQKHQRFAVAGGTGQIGLPISQSLAAAGFQVTVLSRTAKPSSDKNTVYTAADYLDESALVEVLKGHDVVIDALGFTAILADQDLPKRLARATKTAGVKLFVPNDWSFDMERVAERNEIAVHPIANSELDYHKYLQNELKLPFLGIWTGIFASWVPVLLGIDFDAHTSSFVGKGDTPFTSTGYGDIGRFVAAAFTNLAPSQLENRTLRVVSQLKSANEILKELAEKTGSGEFKRDNMSIEEAKAKASNIDFNNLFESMSPWLKLVAETGNGGGENNDNAFVHFEPKESIVDTILADRRAASGKQ